MYSVRGFFTPGRTTSSQRECAEDFEPSHLLANTLRVPRWCDEACEFFERLFQVWYIRALSIKQEDHILSIEVTAYTQR